MAGRPQRRAGGPTKEALVRLEQDKIKAAELKESRIEQIAGLMRQFADSQGKPVWTRAVRKALAAAWKMQDWEIKKLSAIASKRVRAEVNDPEEVRRNVGVVLDTGLRTTLAKGDWNNASKLASVALKMTEGPIQVEITAKTAVRQPTPADAAQAVREVFGVRVSNSSNEKPILALPVAEAEIAEEDEDESADGSSGRDPADSAEE